MQQVMYNRNLDSNLLILVSRIDRIILSSSNKNLVDEATKTKKLLYQFYYHLPFVVVHKEDDVDARACEKWRINALDGRGRCLIYDDGRSKPMICFFLPTITDKIKCVKFLNRTSSYDDIHHTIINDYRNAHVLDSNASVN